LPQPAPIATTSAKPSPKKATAEVPTPSPTPAAPIASHKVHAAHDSDDSDDNVTTAASVPLARKRRVIDSDSEDDHRPQAGPLQTEDGEEVNFSPQKDIAASKLGKKARERQSPVKPAPAVARPISFSNAVPIAAAPAAKKKKVAKASFHAAATTSKYD
jgi:hypothetical protein